MTATPREPTREEVEDALMRIDHPDFGMGSHHTIESHEDRAHARFLAAAYRALPAQQQWHDIASAPRDSRGILGLTRARRQVVVHWDGVGWKDDNRLCRDPVSWLPLPPPPEEKGG